MAWQPVVALLYLFVLPALIHMWHGRLPPKSSSSRWREVGLTRWALLACLTDSVIFVFCAAFMTLGIGTTFDQGSCKAAFWLCVAFYATGKVLVTWFLVERAQLVHGGLTTRRESRLYRANVLLLLAWITIFAVVCARNRTHLRTDGQCLVETTDLASGIAVGIEVLINLYLSVLFAWPLYRGQWSSPSLKALAVKSLIAVAVSMTFSVGNMIIFTVLHGKEIGWMCLACCTVDVSMTAFTLYIISNSETTAANASASHRASALGATSIHQIRSDQPPTMKRSHMLDVDDDPALWRGDTREPETLAFGDLVGQGSQSSSADISESTKKEAEMV
ncbi:hypothetical protein T439DRAFT_328957 [Meredithblackwellia eburnea MCA 4105]